MAVLATYAGVLRNGWVLLDDPEYVFANPHVNRGLTLDGVRWFLHTPHVGNWHPLTSIVHMLNVEAFGLHPAGHHGVSVALHALTAILLAVALARLTGAWWKSVLVAGLFALHPLRVESVAWASELKDVLSSVFFMLALLAYARWAERPRPARYALVAVCLALGLMAKPMLVTLPCVLVVLDVWPLGRLRGFPQPGSAATRPSSAPARSPGGLLLEKGPLFVLVGASSVTTFLVQRSTGAVVAAANLSLPARLANASISYWRYVGLSFWPHGLVPFYPLTATPDLARGALGALGLVATTALVAWQARRRPYLLTGWLWYGGMLVPVIGLVQVGMQSHADRYTYLPTIGLAVAIVWALDGWLPAARAVRITAIATACAVLGVLAAATAHQVTWWRDNRTMFTRVLALDPDNAVAHHCLGTELLRAGRPQEAILHFAVALRVVPGFADARLDYGSALAMLRRYDEAIAQFRETLLLKDTAGARHNLGLALMHLGRLDEAILEYRAALREDPDHYETLVELATTLGKRGQIGAADPLLRRAVELHPAAAKTRRMLAATLTLEGDVEEAIQQFGELARRDTMDLDALNNIAWIRATHPDPRRRDGAEAVRLAELARDRSKEPVAALYSTLAAAYAEAGRMPDAVRAGARAVELARAERDSAAATGYAQQLAGYREGHPFHFGR